MKNHLTPSSHRQDNSSGAARKVTEDWKRLFRLNTLDLNPQLQAVSDQQHWVTQEPHLMRLLEKIRDDVASLNDVLDAAGELTLPTDTNNLLAMLGLIHESVPSTVPEKLRFTSRAIAGIMRFHRHASVVRMQSRSASATALTG